MVRPVLPSAGVFALLPVTGQFTNAPPAVRGARPYILHEAPSAKLFTDTVIVGQRHHAANDIDIPGGGDGSHGGIGNQKACDRSTHEHQLLTQSLTKLRSGTARVRSRALQPRTASKMASNSPSAVLRALIRCSRIANAGALLRYGKTARARQLSRSSSQ